jgi:hypothetical protein
VLLSRSCVHFLHILLADVWTWPFWEKGTAISSVSASGLNGEIPVAMTLDVMFDVTEWRKVLFMISGRTKMVRYKSWCFRGE